MFFKILFLLLSLSTGAAAAEPLAPYYGVWTGDGATTKQKLSITATMREMNGVISGSYNAVVKGSATAYKGSYRAVRKENSCYKVFISPLTRPAINFEADACVETDGTIRARSLVFNGNVKPLKDFMECVFEFSGITGGITGKLHKKADSAGKTVKKAQGAKKAAPVALQPAPKH